MKLRRLGIVHSVPEMII